MQLKSLIFISMFFIITAAANTSFSQEGRSRLRALAAGKKAMELYRAGKYDESAAIFKQILEKNRKNIISKEMLALIGFKTNDPIMAKEYAQLALQQNSRSIRAHLVLAYVFREKGNRLAALDHYRKAKKYAVTQNDKDFIEEYVLRLEPSRREDIPYPLSRETTEPVLDNKPYIAVFAFEEAGADSAGQLGQTVSEMLVTALLKTNRFTVFERSQLNKILEEQALGLSGALDTETAVDVGQLIGVDAILAGSCSQIGTLIELDARLVQATSGEIKTAANGSAQTVHYLRQAVEEIAAKLAANADKIEHRAGENKEE